MVLSIPMNHPEPSSFKSYSHHLPVVVPVFSGVLAQQLRFVRAGYGLVPFCFALLPIPDLWRWGFHGPSGTVDTAYGEKVRRGDEFL
ncbi:hypothetical protein F2Q69_00022479 [Brassica cretica]|uniref:Uncharacterized protein n=1 Tax=Brassica cretica TaxID=69181 RepID=A0A8S9QQ23_BRACR|nr:hypothetical protein F2Q69_00022479 [Brassica cretica]